MLAFTKFEYSRGYRRSSVISDFSIPEKWNRKRQAVVISRGMGQPAHEEILTNIPVWVQCTWGASVVQTSKNIRKHPTAKLTSLGESTCNGSLKSYYSLTTTDMLPACRLVTGFPDSSVGKNPPAMQEILVRFLGWEDPLEKG